MNNHKGGRVNYFIVYTYFTNKRREYGNCEIKTTGLVSSIKDVAIMEKQLRKTIKNKTLVITNFKRFE